MKRNEMVIKDLLERQIWFQKQLDSQIDIIDSQKQQIRILEEKIDILEISNKKLSEGIKQLIKENEKMDELCIKQQMLLDEFSKMLE